MATKKTTPTANTTNTKVANFTRRALQDLNKTEKQLQEEAVENFRLDALIDTKMCISAIETANIPKLQGNLTRAQRSLEVTENNYERVRFSPAYDYQTYLQNRQNSLSAIKRAKENISSIESQIREEEGQLAIYKEILADLS